MYVLEFPLEITVENLTLSLPFLLHFLENMVCAKVCPFLQYLRFIVMGLNNLKGVPLNLANFTT